MPMVASSLLVPLSALCSHDDVEIARQACGAIANIAESKRAHKLLASVGNCMHVMVFVMRSKHLSVHREASRAVSNMLSSSAFHRLFLDDGGLVSLFRLCHSLDVEVQHDNDDACIESFNNNNNNNTFNPLIYNFLLIYILIYILIYLPSKVQYNCALIFRKLSPVLSNHEFIVGKGGLTPLQILTRTPDVNVNR